MFSADEENSETLVPTSFDLERLKELRAGDNLDGEIGNWRVCCYNETCYILLLSNPNIRGNHGYFEFTSLERLIEFLNK